ncbi:MAG: hypothetical protein ABUL46_00375, partial [Chitinophaga rupis]
MIKILRQAFYFIAAVFALASCSKDKSSTSSNSDDSYNYILLTNEADLGTPGYMAAYNKLPGGDLSNVFSKTLQMTEVFGFTQYKKWIFNRTSIAGQAGIQKFTVSADGKINDAGFIADGQMFHVVSDTEGYYLDEKRGTMLLQRFNPTTMQRTGQIDLSSLSLSGVEYQVVGKHIIASKEGKLFVGVTYGTTAAQGYGDDVVNYVKIAVIDIATNTYEKSIQYDGLKGLGWGSSANKFWTLGDDGALYFYSTGFNSGMTNSAVIRIRKGETDFDKNWIL